MTGSSSQFQRFWRVLIVIGAGVVLSGCGWTGSSIDGVTTLEFRGMTPQDANMVEAVLRRNSLSVVRKDGGQGTSFETRDITTAKQMGGIHKQILELAAAERIELNFEGTTFSYSSLTASGSALTTVTIQASPGATAYIADVDGRNPWRLIRLDRSGRWQGSVRTRGRVSDQGGWLYVAFTRDDRLFRYLRVNVLTGEQQNTSYSQAQRAGLSEPTGGNSIRTGGGDPSSTESSTSPPASEQKKSSSGFKWPWEN